ncbi:hypothetical protein EC973_006988 [Apophysomyces ossiformis]|uniref:EamA domain-containing protein n=1 Tax=Apophysomyces ossiformis TaxID=679940 RepID=A0A8H7EQ47_9FUNG|nr:hypothetical protein EC973_006988 [Apophysomyces ossiformis]
MPFIMSRSFLGVVIVSYEDQVGSAHETSRQPLLGDLLAVLGALFYGCYTTFLKLHIGDESRISMPLFFGFVGVFNVIPLALVGDIVIKHTIPDLKYAGGAVLVLIGFFAVNVAALSDAKEKVVYDDHELVPQEEPFEEDEGR